MHKIFGMITDYLQAYFTALVNLTLEMAPYLLLGFLIAGVLHVYFPAHKVNRFMGKPNLKSVINAALLGIPLPLCSCGVLPTGMSFYRNGAAKGPTHSFLISTPQTGVDSILATYSMLGLPMAIIRPVIALVSGVFGGMLTNALDKDGKAYERIATGNTAGVSEKGNSIVRMLRYSFVTFLQDISKWLTIGLLLAALMAVLIPDDFFSQTFSNEYLSMALILPASALLYVCATGSIPMAAVLIAKGLSPGAVIVFLMAGPATSAASMAVVGNVMGRKALATYLFSIITAAVFFGVIVNEFLPREWFVISGSHAHHYHENHLLPYWLSVASGIALTALLLNATLARYKHLIFRNKTDVKHENIMEQKTIKVSGMDCNHCKMSVERNLGALENVQNIEVDLATGKVKISGDNVNLQKVKQTVEEIGYKYAGEA